MEYETSIAPKRHCFCEQAFLEHGKIGSVASPFGSAPISTPSRENRALGTPGLRQSGVDLIAPLSQPLSFVPRRGTGERAG